MLHFFKKWALFVLTAAMSLPAMADLETPKYKILQAAEPFEIRQYEPYMVAEVLTEGERDDAVNAGFRLLADFIFGNNTVTKKIDMTAPVTQQSEKIDMTLPITQQSTKIDMTAPVTQQAEADQWRITFTMPSQYTMQTLPKPNNDKVKIKTIPAKKFVVIVFSGTHSDSNIAEHQALLDQYVKDNKLKTRGTHLIAFYNSPWSLPFMRRNEVLLELR